MYTVSDLTKHIRYLIEQDDVLQDVCVQGEVSNAKQAASGHWYFTLKDANAQLKCVMWRSDAELNGISLKDGDAIEACGSIGVYEARGEYQLYAKIVRPLGIGDLYQQFEQLKARLQAEGLFDRMPRPIPPYPQKIGVVTSPDAAAFRDIQNVLKRRYPLVEVILSPTIVQGVDAPPRIVQAIERLNVYGDVDVIIVARGGGSIEDLWAFNDESVARAVAASHIPTITGVGHETDFTIVDFVSDHRAPTPSAAAELATPDRYELEDTLRQRREQLIRLFHEHIIQRREQTARMERLLRTYSPESDIRTYRQRLDDLHERLNSQTRRHINLLRERLAARSKALQMANPQALLARGYAIVTRSEDGVRVKRERDAKPGTPITITLHEGELKARVEDKVLHEQYKRTLF